MPSASRPSRSKEKTTPEIQPAWAYWHLQATGTYTLAVAHGERPRTPKPSEGDPIIATEPIAVPAALLGADGVSPNFGEIAKLAPRPVTPGERDKEAAAKRNRAAYLDPINEGL